MVEIHEPVRNLFVIEADHEVLSRVLHANPLLTELLENRWVRVSTVHPESGEIHVWRGGGFELRTSAEVRIPQARTSVEWYAGKLEHLPVARIGKLEHAIS